MKGLWIYILLLGITLFADLWAQTGEDGYDPFGKQVDLISNGQDTVTVLLDKFLIPSTVTVSVDSLVLQENEDYVVDYRSGEIRWVQPPDSGQPVRIVYRQIPTRLQLEYRHWTASDSVVLGERGEGEVPLARPTAERASIEYGSELQRSGSVFRGITLGTDQGMRLQSGLRLQVSGNIAQNVEVVASLTDQNTPIQPEGNTQTLQEIDKVFVNILGPGFRTTLGDYVYQVDGIAFGSYSKKLQGAMGTVETALGELTLSAAASKGRFTTNHFMGQESNQGPYQLTGGQGERIIIVLAGTERVWVDGELMVRGEDNDYTIEYGNGQITFTRNRLITEESRITVDFEYSDQEFQKEIYGAATRVKVLDNRVALKGSFLREADDKDHPLETSLTDENRSVLATAGDDPDSAVVSGVNYVGENQGSYRQADSAGVVIYHYAGPDQGDYVVRFSYVGYGKGDYSLQGYGIYRYEGEGRGSYLPIVYLPVATHHQMVDLMTSVDLGRGISIEGEVGLSDQDLNTYSSVDDDDNVDAAFRGQFQLDPNPLRLFGKGLGTLGFTGSIRSVGDGFRSVGRMTEVEHGRKWGVEESSSWGGERIQELQGSYRPFDSWVIEGEMGSFKRGENLHSERKMISTTLSQAQVPRIAYQVERIRTEKTDGYRGLWLRQKGSVSGEKWGLSPSFHYEGEDRQEEVADSVRTGFRFDIFTGGLVFSKGAFRGEIQETFRDDGRYNGSLLDPYSSARTDQIRLDVRPGNAFSTSLMLTHRNRDYADPSLLDQKSDLADAKVRFSPWNRFVDGSLNYLFSSTQISQTVRDTINVGAGLGDYRYDEDLQELVPDPDGDIVYRTIQTGIFLPVNYVKAGGELRLDGSKLWNEQKGFRRFLSSWKSRSLVRIERRDRDRNFGEVNRSAFSPRWGSDPTLVMGLFSYYQDFEYVSRSSGFSLKLHFRKDDSENHQLLYEGLVHHIREEGVLVKGNMIQKLGLLFEYQRKMDLKDYSNRAWSNRNIRLHEWTVETSYRPQQKIEIALKAKFRTGRDRYPDPTREVHSLFLYPRFGYSFQGRGLLRAELEIGEVRSEPENRTLPYEILGGDQPGRTLRWTVLLTYQVTGHVMVTMNYRGRQEPWRDKLYQYGQVEVRAFF